MTHEYMKSEEVAAIREFYQTLPLDLDRSVLAVRGDFLRLIDDWQALMEENQRLQSELEEYTKANWAAQGREEKLVEALRWYADERNHLATHFDAGETYVGYDGGQRARDTLKALGIE
jgi:predicted nuclease with TOPRIM domain